VIRFLARRRSKAALGAADQLVAEGKAADAIQLLTNANRRRRDNRIEKRLVDLRFEAFNETPWVRQRSTVPKSVEDLFPGKLIPEVAREELTVDTVRSGIIHHGSLLVRGLANRDQVDRLTADIDKSLAAFDAQADGVDRPELTGWFNPFTPDRTSNRTGKRSRGSVLAVDSPPALFDLIEILRGTGIRQLAREFFGEPAMILAKKVTLRKISRDARTGGWHQDGAFMGAGIRSLNLWLSLSHCGDDAPGLDVVGRRFEGLVQSGDGAFAAWGVKPHIAEQAAAGTIERPIFEPGDALLLDHLTLHRTAVDVGMTSDRYAIETWLFAPSTYDAMTAKGEQSHEPRDQIPILF
jgi:hypothetical protein